MSVHPDDHVRSDPDFGDVTEPTPPADPQFDAWLVRQAPAINAPNPTPRDAMWSAIQAAQHTHRLAASGDVAGVRPLVRRWRIPAAIAAALVLGVAIDRLALRRHDDWAEPASRVVAATTPRARPDSARIGGADSGAARTAEVNVAARSGPPHSTDARARHGHEPRTARDDTAGTSRLYRLVAVQTLGQAEALLTAYRTTDVAARSSPAARPLGAWAREVLTSTRLLLDSPAGGDPELRAVLNDLELVLVQIVRLSGAPLDASDRALIDRVLRDNDLLPRIRTVVPAGGASGTTSDA